MFWRRRQAIRVCNETQFKAAAKKLGVTEVLPGGNTLAQNQVNVHAAQAAEKALALANALRVGMASAREPAEVTTAVLDGWNFTAHGCEPAMT